MATKHELDRSTMFTNLLTLSKKFGQLSTRAGEAIVTEVLAGWYDSTDSDMFQFAHGWLLARHPELCPLTR